MLKRKKITALVLSIALAASLIPRVSTNADTSVITRFSGKDRYATSLAISKNGWTTANSVIIATGDSFPDALCAAPLSKKKDAPIILTEKQALSSDTIDEIVRLQAKEAYIVGGIGVVSDNVEKQLKALGLVTERYAGLNRYETSVKVAEQIGTDKGVVISTGANFPDALSIAPIAAMEGMPILLSDTNTLPAEVENLVKTKFIPKSYLVGGTGVLSNKLKVQLPNTKRLGGASRYETNLNIIKEFADKLNFNDLYVATGENFPDALSGSALAAKLNAPVILTDGTISTNAESYLKSLNIIRLNLLGGTGVISESLASKYQNTVKYNTILSIDNFTDTAFLNKKYSLPSKVLAIMQDQTTSLVPVSWNSNTVDTSKLGTYTYEGTVEGFNGKVTLTLKVTEVTSSVNGNFGNGGLIYEDEDIIYNALPGSIYKINNDFSGKKILSLPTEDPTNITSIGDSIYYMDKNDRNLHKIKSDGTGGGNLTFNGTLAYYISGNVLYYSDSIGTGIQKMDLSMNNKTLICDKAAAEMLVKDDWIFFCTYSTLYKVKTDGSQLTQLSNDCFGSNISVEDGYVYYLAGINDKKLNKVSIDGGTPTQLLSCNVYTYNVSRGWIYYSNADQGYGLYKMRTDGSNNQRFGNYTSGSIHILGDNIYMRDSNTFHLCKIKIDGTETQQYGEQLTVGTPVMYPIQVFPVEVFLNWTQEGQYSRFEVYRSSTKYGGYSYIGNVSSCAFSDRTTAPGNTYWYRVRAINSSNEESDFSEPICAVVQ